jgi:TIR domain/NACHT domain
MSVQSPALSRFVSTVDVFISYRRVETRYSAGWLHDYLTSRLGRDRVFLDIDVIRPGVDFMQAIYAAIAQAKVMLVMIGPRWLADEDERSRLADPADPVRLEIEAAFRADLLVIPLLLDGAPMPSRDQLPPTMARLAALNAASIRQETFRQKLDELLQVIADVLPDAADLPPPTEPLPPPNRPVRVTPPYELARDGTQRSRLVAKLDHIYAEFLRQAVQDDRVVTMPLRWRRAPEKVRRRADILLPLGRTSEEPVAEGTTLLSLFDEAGGLDGDGLLVLGEPGAGKSTALVTFARGLLERAVDDVARPVPVYLPLRTWGGERRTIETWALQQLGELYQIPPDLAARWTRESRLIFLLDGLDELPQRATRIACVTEINRFQRFGQEHRLPIVVTARQYEYDSLPELLELEDAVVVLPLAPDEVERRIADEGPQMHGVLAALRDDEGMRDMLTSPLLLSMITRTYLDSAVVAAGEGRDRRTRLFATYVESRFASERATRRDRRTNRYPPSATRSWLSRLATQMTEHQQLVFDLGRLQADWLPHRAGRWVTAALPGLLFGLAYAASATATLHGALECCLVTGLGAGATVRMLPAVHPGRPLVWSRSTAAAHLLPSLTAALLVAVASTLTDVFLVAVNEQDQLVVLGLDPGRAVALALAIAVALVVLGGFTPSDDPALARWAARPERLWAVYVGIVVAMTTGLAGAVVSGPGEGGRTAVSWGAFAGISAWLVGTSGPAERLSWSWRRSARHSRSALALGLVLGTVVFAGYGPYAGLQNGLGAGAIFAVGAGVVAFLVSGFTRGDIPVHVTPNEATRRSLYSGLLVGGVAFALLATAFGSLPLLILPGPPDLGLAVEDGVAVGFPVSSTLAVTYGLGAATQHWLIRFLLWRNNAAPLRYARWLDYAVELKLLYRNGAGGYVFIHAHLREYFMHLTRGASDPGTE